MSQRKRIPPFLSSFFLVWFCFIRIAKSQRGRTKNACHQCRPSWLTDVQTAAFRSPGWALAVPLQTGGGVQEKSKLLALPCNLKETKRPQGRQGTLEVAMLLPAPEKSWPCHPIFLRKTKRPTPPQSLAWGGPSSKGHRQQLMSLARYGQEQLFCFLWGLGLSLHLP